MQADIPLTPIAAWNANGDVSSFDPTCSQPVTFNEFEKPKQVILQNGCKRRKLSPSVTKAELARRLRSAGFKTMHDLRRISLEFVANHVDELVSTRGCNKSPNRTMMKRRVYATPSIFQFTAQYLRACTGSHSHVLS